jgi:hypothetical protein
MKVDSRTKTTAPRSAPEALAKTSDTDVVRSTVRSWSDSTPIVSASPSVATRAMRAASERGRASAHIPKNPNGPNRRTLPTKSGIETRCPVSAAMNGFHVKRARWSATRRRSWTKLNGIVVP